MVLGKNKRNRARRNRNNYSNNISAGHENSKTRIFAEYPSHYHTTEIFKLHRIYTSPTELSYRRNLKVFELLQLNTFTNSFQRNSITYLSPTSNTTGKDGSNDEPSAPESPPNLCLFPSCPHLPKDPTAESVLLLRQFFTANFLPPAFFLFRAENGETLPQAPRQQHLPYR